MNRWLTPNAAGGETARRVLSIPVELLPHVNGALQQLTEVWNWEQDGTMTPDQAAALSAAMMEEYYVTILGDDVNGRLVTVPVWRPIAHSASWVWEGANNQFNGGWWRSNTADPSNNSVTFQAWIGDGVWYVRSLMATTPQSAIVEVDLNGAYIGQWDNYSNPIGYNVIRTSNPWVCPYPGLYQLVYRSVGKFGSSGGYRISLSDIVIERAG